MSGGRVSVACGALCFVLRYSTSTTTQAWQKGAWKWHRDETLTRGASTGRRAGCRAVLGRDVLSRITRGAAAGMVRGESSSCARQSFALHTWRDSSRHGLAVMASVA